MQYIYFVVYEAGGLGNTKIISDRKLITTEDVEEIERKLSEDLNLANAVILYFRLLEVEEAN